MPKYCYLGRFCMKNVVFAKKACFCRHPKDLDLVPHPAQKNKSKIINIYIYIYICIYSRTHAMGPGLGPWAPHGRGPRGRGGRGRGGARGGPQRGPAHGGPMGPGPWHGPPNAFGGRMHPGRRMQSRPNAFKVECNQGRMHKLYFWGY